jgi:hypothetical protein
MMRARQRTNINQCNHQQRGAEKQQGDPNQRSAPPVRGKWVLAKCAFLSTHWVTASARHAHHHAGQGTPRVKACATKHVAPAPMTSLKEIPGRPQRHPRLHRVSPVSGSAAEGAAGPTCSWPGVRSQAMPAPAHSTLSVCSSCPRSLSMTGTRIRPLPEANLAPAQEPGRAASDMVLTVDGNRVFHR